MGREAIQLTRMRDMIRDGKARDLRIAARLSLAEVARECLVDPSTPYYWERGRIPRGKPAVRYARLLADLERLLLS